MLTSIHAYFSSSIVGIFVVSLVFVLLAGIVWFGNWFGFCFGIIRALADRSVKDRGCRFA